MHYEKNLIMTELFTLIILLIMRTLMIFIILLFISNNFSEATKLNKYKYLHHVYIPKKNMKPEIREIKPLKCPSYYDFRIKKEKHRKVYGPYYSIKENHKLPEAK